MTLFELDLPKSYEAEYFRMMKNLLIKRIKEGVSDTPGHTCILPDEYKEILLPNWNTDNPDTSIIKHLLTDEPKPLKALNDKIIAEFEQKQYVDESMLKIIEHVMGYESVFNSSSKSKAYKLALKIGAKTCCYCNRQYTFTVVGNDNKTKEDRLTRPSFDHWFPKSKYPLMSISLYNLIPSCTVCNSSAKGDHDVNLNDYIHPYVHLSRHPQIKFKAVPATEPDKVWTVKIARKDNSPEDNTIKMFYLDQIYKMHDTLELKDIMDFNDNYPGGFLRELVKLVSIKGDSISREEAYRMLFGVKYNDEKHLDRPFGKMKNDILKDIMQNGKLKHT